MTRFIRWTTVLAVLAAVIVAGWASWTHGYHVALSHHQPPGLAAIYPGTIEGLVYSAGMVVLDYSRRIMQVPRFARFILVTGIIATAGVNLWFGWRYGISTAIISAWPAVAVVLSYEMLMIIIKGQQAEVVDASAAPRENAAPEPEAKQPFAGLGKTSEFPTSGAGIGIPANGGGLPKAEAPAKPERARHAKGHPTPQAAEREFYREIERGEIPSLKEIQNRLHVGADKAKSYQAHFAEVGRVYREQVIR